MLILFDIDLTLLTSGGAGEHALALAGRDVYGAGYRSDGLEVAGRLDTLIFADLVRLNEPTDPERDAQLSDARVLQQSSVLQGRYTTHLAEQLPRADARALPGVHALLEALRDHESRNPAPVLGLLTGNMRKPGRLKLAACAIDHSQFRVQAWCDFAPPVRPTRADLVPVAMQQYAAHTGRPALPRQVVIVGDTPHDVACAKAHGCRAVGVATGRTSAAALHACGADAVFADLSCTSAVLDALRDLLHA